MEYTTVREDDDDTLVIKDDSENHNHRLTSWIKVTNSKINKSKRVKSRNGNPTPTLCPRVG